MAATLLTIVLPEAEKKALEKLSTREFREPRAQAFLIIREELVRQGFIQREQTSTQQKAHLGPIQAS